jgi:hypothetical protein
MEILSRKSGPQGIAVEQLINCAAVKGLPKEVVLMTIRELVRDDDCYQPRKGYVKLL